VHPKWFLSRWYVWRKLCPYLALTLTLSLTQKEVRFHITHITREFHRVCPKWFLSLWYDRRKPCTYLASRLALSPKGPKRASTWALSPSGIIVSRTISEPMVRLAQTMHLSCTDTNTASKLKEVRLHMTHVTLVFCRVHPKWFPSLWYVQHKLCTYLKSRLALSPNSVPSGASKWIFSLWYFWHKLCTYLVSRLALSPKGQKRASTWASSPRRTIKYVQNNFWANGTYSANHAPILHWHLHSLQMERREIAHGPCHLGVPSPKMISEPMVLSMQIVHLSCIKVSTVSKWNELSLEPHDLAVPSGASKTISEPIVCLVQTMHLSCTDTNTVSK
jgi:hypothetical protein